MTVLTQSLAVSPAKKTPSILLYDDTTIGTGRWCAKPLLPLLCDECRTEDNQLPLAEGFRYDLFGLRRGVCHSCLSMYCYPGYRGGVAETRLYFSGVSSSDEASMLEEAGVKYVLADQFDYPNIENWPGSKIIDSGAYALAKKGQPLDVEAYLTWAATRVEADLIIAPDVYRDPEGTYRNWKKALRIWHSLHVNNLGSVLDPQLLKLVPVWPWGSNRAHLDEYLNEAPVVAIGGLVLEMRRRPDWGATRDKAKKVEAEKEQLLQKLEDLCKEHIGRFHILGCNWLRAIERLNGLAASLDTSKWLDAARYGHVIFENTKTGHLSSAPYRAVPEYAHLEDRRERCILSARNMQKFMLSEWREPKEEK